MTEKIVSVLLQLTITVIIIIKQIKIIIFIFILRTAFAQLEMNNGASYSLPMN